jgi:hypothetical protein
VKDRTFERALCVGAILLGSATLSGCTPTTGKITGDVLTGLCDIGFMAIGAPSGEVICGDINVIEQMIANRNKTAAAGATVVAPMSQGDLFAMVKASGQWRPAKVK